MNKYCNGSSLARARLVMIAERRSDACTWINNSVVYGAGFTKPPQDMKRSPSRRIVTVLKCEGRECVQLFSRSVAQPASESSLGGKEEAPSSPSTRARARGGRLQRTGALR